MTRLLDFESERRTASVRGAQLGPQSLPLRVRGVIGAEAEGNKERAVYANSLWYNPVKWVSAGHYAITERSSSFNAGNPRQRSKHRTYYHGCRVDPKQCASSGDDPAGGGEQTPSPSSPSRSTPQDKENIEPTMTSRRAALVGAGGILTGAGFSSSSSSHHLSRTHHFDAEARGEEKSTLRGYSPVKPREVPHLGPCPAQTEGLTWHEHEKSSPPATPSRHENEKETGGALHYTPMENLFPAKGNPENRFRDLSDNHQKIIATRIHELEGQEGGRESRSTNYERYGRESVMSGTNYYESNRPRDVVSPSSHASGSNRASNPQGTTSRPRSNTNRTRESMSTISSGHLHRQAGPGPGQLSHTRGRNSSQRTNVAGGGLSPRSTIDLDATHGVYEDLIGRQMESRRRSPVSNRLTNSFRPRDRVSAIESGYEISTRLAALAVPRSVQEKYQGKNDRSWVPPGRKITVFAKNGEVFESGVEGGFPQGSSFLPQSARSASPRTFTSAPRSFVSATRSRAAANAPKRSEVVIASSSPPQRSSKRVVNTSNAPSPRFSSRQPASFKSGNKLVPPSVAASALWNPMSAPKHRTPRTPTTAASSTGRLSRGVSPSPTHAFASGIASGRSMGHLGMAF
ncbi:unnamed protein product [Amoebophrya sp. A25]|nr:unnamed protein product [Amoebophrya sp. A25]|eukprot:GSA25T00004867001.1